MPFYIKYDVTDVFINPTGLQRPVPNPPGWWNSSSIWFTERDDASATVTKPRIGQDVDIRVQVDADAGGAPPTVSTDITVQAWLSDWTSGGIGPAAVPSGGSTQGAGVKNTLGLIPTVPPSSARVAVIRWTPQPNDFKNVNPTTKEAHMCIAANAYLDVGPGEGTELSTGYIDPVNERHHAQKNIELLPALTGGGEGIMFAANPGDEEARFRILVEPVRGPLGQVERELLLAHPFIQRVGGKPFDPEQLQGKGVLAGPVERFELERGGELALRRGKKKLHKSKKGLGRVLIRVGDDEGKQVKLTIPPTKSAEERVPVEFQLELADPSDIGSVEAVDLLQVDDRKRVVGGVRLLLVAMSEEDLREGEDRAAT